MENVLRLDQIKRLTVEEGKQARVYGRFPDEAITLIIIACVLLLVVFFFPAAIRVYQIASKTFKVRIRSPPGLSERIIAETGCQRCRPLFLLNIQQKIGTQP